VIRVFVWSLNSGLWPLYSTRTMQDQVDSVLWHKKHARLNGVVLCTSLYFFTAFKHVSHHPSGWMRIGVVGLSKEICHEISWSIFMLQMLHWSVTNNTWSILGYWWAQQVYPVKSTWTTCHYKSAFVRLRWTLWLLPAWVCYVGLSLVSSIKTGRKDPYQSGISTCNTSSLIPVPAW
jgi:hypothetical protein